MKPIHVKISNIVIIIVFILLLFNGMPSKAIGFLFVSGGILGIKTKTMPFRKPPQSPTQNFRINYDDDNIIDPLMNILFIIVGLVTLGF